MSRDYQFELKEFIVQYLTENGPSTFCEILSNSLGAYPNDVFDVLNSQYNSTQIYVRGQYYYVQENINRRDQVVKTDIDETEALNIVDFSPAHPADYDWRFTTNTIFKLNNIIKDYVEEERVSNVGLFGVTTLYPLLKSTNKNLSVRLFNKSRILINDLERLGFHNDLYVHDLFFPITDYNNARLIIADPPWYLDYYEAFILRASEVLEQGGFLMLSVLQKLTRPDADKDQQSIIEFSKVVGFNLTAIHEAFFTYQSPEFEKHSLSLINVDCPNWRMGDLYIFKKVGFAELSPLLTVPSDDGWYDFYVCGKKIKVKDNKRTAAKFSFRYADQERTLSTVSRRSKVRENINYWTSDNYAFEVERTEILISFLNLIQNGLSMRDAKLFVKDQYNMDQSEMMTLELLIKDSDFI